MADKEKHCHPKVRGSPLLAQLVRILDKNWCFQDSILRVQKDILV